MVAWRGANKLTHPFLRIDRVEGNESTALWAVQVRRTALGRVLLLEGSRLVSSVSFTKPCLSWPLAWSVRAGGGRCISYTSKCAQLLPFRTTSQGAQAKTHTQHDTTHITRQKTTQHNTRAERCQTHTHIYIYQRRSGVTTSGERRRVEPKSKPSPDGIDHHFSPMMV